MAIKIEGTAKRNSGGGGLGSLLGKIVGGTAGFFVGGPAGVLQGASLGSTAGGAIGGAVKPGSQTDLGIPIEGARDSGFGAPKEEKSAIDRLNSVLDLGTSIAGGAQSINGMMGAPKAAGLSLPNQQNLNRNVFQRRMAGI